MPNNREFLHYWKPNNYAEGLDDGHDEDGHGYDRYRASSHASLLQTARAFQNIDESLCIFVKK